MKQINLTLAKSGDVAVLRNGEQLEIVSIMPHRAKPDTVRITVNHSKVVALTTKLDGTYGINKPNKFDITDILREGVSIFEPK